MVEQKKNRARQKDRGKYTTEKHTNIFFLEFTSQVTLYSETQIRMVKRRRLMNPVLTLTKVVFPVPPSPTTRHRRSRGKIVWERGG